MKVLSFVVWLASLSLLTAERPNIVVIFCDDLGYGDVGCFMGEGERPGWETPHIDSIAAGGVKLTDFYVSSPVCSASRAALLTGRYHHHVGINGALMPSSKLGMPAEEVTLGELCQSAGYATAAYGKWHLGCLPEHRPVRHGFDDYFGYPYSNDMWPHGPVDFTGRGKYPELPLIEDDEVVALVRDQQWMTTWITERAVRFIEEKKDKPFFLYLAHPQPHVPLYVSPLRRGKSKDGLYGDVIQEIDWSTGEILGALERAGVKENTWVIFTSDNGPWMLYGNHGGRPGPLRGSKGTCWEGGVRVPCVMQWPAKLKPGTVVKTPLMTIDLLPTIAKLLEVPAPPKVDGKDAWPVISGAQTEPVQEAYYFYYGNKKMEAMRMGKWKLQFPHKWRDPKPSPGNDGARGKYVYHAVGTELFDLEKDVGETRDVSGEFPEVVERMRALAEERKKGSSDRVN